MQRQLVSWHEGWIKHLFIINSIRGHSYIRDRCPVPYGNSLYIISDGVYEVEKADGSTWRFSEFVDFIKKLKTDSQSVLDRLYEYAAQIAESDKFEDDFTIVEVVFK